MRKRVGSQRCTCESTIGPSGMSASLPVLREHHSEAGSRAAALTKLLVHGGLQCWKMLLDDLPDTIKPEVQVGMRGDVAESVDRAPADVWMSRLDLCGQLAGSLRQRLKSPQHRILNVHIL